MTVKENEEKVENFNNIGIADPTVAADSTRVRKCIK